MAVRGGIDQQVAALLDAARTVPADWEADLLLAARAVRVRVAGPVLAELVRRPLAHLVLGDSACRARPELAIYLTDGRDLPLVRLLRETAAGLTTTWVSPHLEVRSSPCGRLVGIDHGPGHAFLVDREQGLVVGELDPRRLGMFDRVKPLLLPLRVCLRDAGARLVHAGLVADGGAGALIGGPGGAGKSSVAVACFVANLALLGDDQCAVTDDGRGPVGHSLYGAVQIEAGWLPRIAAFPTSAIAVASTGEKSAIFLSEVTPERLRRSAPIRVVVLPRVAPGRPTAASPAGKAEALLRIAPSTVFQPLGAEREDVLTLSRLLQRTPAYWLDLGEDGARAPELVRQLLAGVPAR